MTQEYIGVKRVTAWPQDGKDGQPGYAVRYEGCYTSWSPKDVFESAYKSMDEIRANDATWEFLGSGVHVRAEGSDPSA